MHFIYIVPFGGKGESHESLGNQALRTLETGVEPSCTALQLGQEARVGGKATAHRVKAGPGLVETG